MGWESCYPINGYILYDSSHSLLDFSGSLSICNIVLFTGKWFTYWILTYKVPGRLALTVIPDLVLPSSQIWSAKSFSCWIFTSRSSRFHRVVSFACPMTGGFAPCGYSLGELFLGSANRLLPCRACDVRGLWLGVGVNPRPRSTAATSLSPPPFSLSY